MGWLWQYWWLIFVFGGPIAAGIRAAAKRSAQYAERRQEIQLEKYRIKHGLPPSAGQSAPAGSPAALAESTQRLMAEHDEVNQRWLDYELDAVRVLEYPLMTDLREPVTLAFHKARRLADSLRPAAPEEMTDPAAQREYRDAVHEYATAFDVAEAEAKRVKQGGFGEQERARLATALRLLNLALDSSASPQERQSAYQRVRKEIDGLIVMPAPADEAISTAIAGELPG